MDKIPNDHASKLAFITAREIEILKLAKDNKPISELVFDTVNHYMVMMQQGLNGISDGEAPFVYAAAKMLAYGIGKTNPDAKTAGSDAFKMAKSCSKPRKAEVEHDESMTDSGPDAAELRKTVEGLMAQGVDPDDLADALTDIFNNKEEGNGTE